MDKLYFGIFYRGRIVTLCGTPYLRNVPCLPTGTSNVSMSHFLIAKKSSSSYPFCIEWSPRLTAFKPTNHVSESQYFPSISVLLDQVVSAARDGIYIRRGSLCWCRRMGLICPVTLFGYVYTSCWVRDTSIRIFVLLATAIKTCST